MMKFSCFHLQFFIALFRFCVLPGVMGTLASVASVAAVNHRSLRSKRFDVKTVCVAASEAMDSKASHRRPHSSGGGGKIAACPPLSAAERSCLVTVRRANHRAALSKRRNVSQRCRYDAGKSKVWLKVQKVQLNRTDDLFKELMNN